MAAKLIYRPENDSVQMGTPGEEIRWTQSMTYINDATPSKTVWEVMNDALVPKQGQRYAVAGETTFPPTFASLQQFVCRSVDISPVPQSPKAWNIRVTWSSRRPRIAQRPWFNLTRTTTFRTAPMFKGGAAIFSGVPANGDMPYPPTAWIGGTSVDANLQPLQVKIAQQQIQVDILWDRSYQLAADALTGAAASHDPPSEWTSVYSASRNNAQFLGWPEGYVAYLGWTANESPDEWLVISHRFLADDWQHLEQRPAPNTAGKPLLATGPTWGSSPAIPTQSAAHVAWYQPYPVRTDFWALFNWQSGLKDALINPKPRWQGQANL
jgi:hypothetical protein